MKTTIAFKNERKEDLRGVLSTPSYEKSAEGKDLVIMPNCGLMGAEGDYRSHYRIAEHLISNGYHVLRFSPAGLGLSDGEIKPCRTKDLFGMIESGLFVDDISSAVNYMSSLGSFKTITLIGVCGGGISSLLAAAKIKKIDSVIPISCPVILDSDTAQYSTRVSRNNSEVVFNIYRDKIFSLRAWFRLLSFKSDLNVIRGGLLGVFKKKISYVENNKSGFLYNNHFHEALIKVISRNKSCLFIYGGQDNFYFEFEDLFLKKFYKNSEKLPFDLNLIRDGNHMFSLPEMQEKVAEVIVNWLDILPRKKKSL